MAESKQQTLTQLYSLRAGISAVACERNKVEDINGKTDKEVKELNDKINNLRNENRTLEENKKNNSIELDATKKRLIDSSELREPSNKRFIKLRRIYLTLSILLWTFAVGFMVFIVILSMGERNGAVSVILYFFLVFGVATIIQPILTACFRNPINDAKEYYENSRYDYESGKKNNKSNQQLIKQLETENTKINYKIPDNEKQISEYQNKIEQLKTDAVEARAPHYKLGGLIQEQFEKQFNSFLNLRDWRNVDIIIFAYESGRVDNMRDALSYADAETRTDRVVAAINDSSQAVCRSIRSGLYDLAQSMGRCLSVISNQIAVQTKKLDKIAVNMENLSLNTANLAKSAEGYSQSLASLAAKVDYSNALQEQRNISSTKLVEENEMFMVQARNYMRILDTEVSINGGRIN